MKERLEKINLYQFTIAVGGTLLILIASFFFVALLLLPAIAGTLHLGHMPQGSFPFPYPQPTSLPTSLPSSATQTAPAQQVVTVAQNDVSIANTIVTFTGVFVGIVAVTLSIAGYFGINEVVKIRALRTNLEKDVKEINDNAVQVKSQIDSIVVQFTAQLELITQHTSNIELRLKELDKRIESESQKFLEAAYYFSEGRKAYSEGGNERAIEFYLSAQKIQPNSPRILERIGRAYSNLNDRNNSNLIYRENAYRFLSDALKIDPDFEPALRSLALLFRYTDPQQAITYLKRIIEKNEKAYEAWDFLGLFYRDELVRELELLKDQQIINKAIKAHEKALLANNRPETAFYLGILLLFSPIGDKIRAKELLISASQMTPEPEHDLRLRQVWKILIQASVSIIDDDKQEALRLLKSLENYKTTQRNYETVKTHLRFLLAGCGHENWLGDLMALVIV